MGFNDIFEVIKSYQDKREYIISSNKNNHNLDIFQLLENNKIMSLKGHKEKKIKVLWKKSYYLGYH